MSAKSFVVLPANKYLYYMLTVREFNVPITINIAKNSKKEIPIDCPMLNPT